jgi:hypothetical protein
MRKRLWYGLYAAGLQQVCIEYTIPVDNAAKPLSSAEALLHLPCMPH